MVANEKKLGRGIASLLAMDDDIEIPTISNDNNIEDSVFTLNISDIITNNSQPRKFFDDLKIKELSESIKHNGLLQPIIVVKTHNDKYMIVAGERRYRATKLAGLDKIKAIIIEMEEKDILKNALIENIQRENLNPVEEANGYKKIIEDFGYTHEQLAKEIGKSRAYITNLLRILNLPHEVLSALKNNNITLGHAKVLLSTDKPMEYLDKIIEKSLSVRQLEQEIKNENTLQNISNSINDKQKDEEQKNGQFETSNITFDLIKQMYGSLSKKDNDIECLISDDENIDSKNIDELSYEEKKIINDNLKIIEKHLLKTSNLITHLRLNRNGSGKIEIEYKDSEELLKIINKLQ